VEDRGCAIETRLVLGLDILHVVARWDDHKGGRFGIICVRNLLVRVDWPEASRVLSLVETNSFFFQLVSNSLATLAYSRNALVECGQKCHMSPHRLGQWHRWRVV
jgi:hypothetical protein